MNKAHYCDLCAGWWNHKGECEPGDCVGVRNMRCPYHADVPQPDETFWFGLGVPL